MTWGRVLVRLLESVIPKHVTLIVDDTLCRRSGPRILGAGMFVDPLTSSASNGANRHTSFAFSLNKEMTAVWKSAGHARSIKVVVTRDPSGRLRGGYVFSTQSDMRAEELLAIYARR